MQPIAVKFRKPALSQKRRNNVGDLLLLENTELRQRASDLMLEICELREALDRPSPKPAFKVLRRE